MFVGRDGPVFGRKVRTGARRRACMPITTFDYEGNIIVIPSFSLHRLARTDDSRELNTRFNQV